MKIHGWIAVAVGLMLAASTGLARGQSPSYGLAEIVPAAVRLNGSAGDAGCDTGCDSCAAACDSAGLECDGCDGGGCSSCCAPCGWCNLGEPFTLFGEHCSGVTGGGWFQLGYTNYSTNQFNNHPYNVDLHQAYGWVEKAADGSCGWDWGVRMDYVYGVDGPDTQAFGNPPGSWDIGWDAGGFYGHAIPQLYGELAYQDWSIKVGHFYTIIGWEVVPATGNYFYSHAFTMNNGEPFTHTGVLVNKKMSDGIEVWGGWTAGWDTGFDKFGGDIFLGGISAAISEDITLIYALTAGNIGFGTNASGYSHSIVADVKLTDNLQYVFQHDLTEYGPRVDAMAINQYLIYTINDCLSTGIRLEWWQSEDANGQKADLYELTYGFNIRPHANVVFRPEIRYDKDDDGVLIPAAHNERLGFGMDMILTF